MMVYPPKWQEYLKAKALEDPRPQPALPDVLHETPYFQIRQSSKGYGAFASQDIPKGTVVLEELPMVSANDLDVTINVAFMALSNEDKAEFLSLAEMDSPGHSKLDNIWRVNAYVYPSKVTL